MTFIFPHLPGEGWGFLYRLFILAELHAARFRERQISVGTAGPQPQAPDLNGHCRTSTASARYQLALPDLNRKRQMSDRMPQRMPDRTSEYMHLRMCIYIYM